MIEMPVAVYLFMTVGGAGLLCLHRHTKKIYQAYCHRMIDMMGETVSDFTVRPLSIDTLYILQGKASDDWNDPWAVDVLRYKARLKPLPNSGFYEFTVKIQGKTFQWIYNPTTNEILLDSFAINKVKDLKLCINHKKKIKSISQEAFVYWRMTR